MITLTSGSTSSSDTTSTGKGVRPPPASSPGGSIHIPGSKPVRQKRKATKPPIIEEGGIDDPGKDPDFEVQEEDVEEPEVEASSSSASAVTSGLSQDESIQKGIPQLPKKGL